MLYHHLYKRSYTCSWMAVALLLLMTVSCKKYIELGAPPTQIGVDDAFKTDATATSAVVGLYKNQFITESSYNPNSGLTFYLTAIPGSSADDIQYSSSDPYLDEFKNDAVTVGNSFNSNNLWSQIYSQMAQINFAVNGLTQSTTLTPAVKNQLLGEAKCWRAFMYFYLVNFYGDVPMPLDADPLKDALLPRTPSDQVWKQIITDLKEAQSLLPESYPTAQRARINKWIAAALLARTYLYTKDYVNAEAQSSLVINSGVYKLEQDVNKVFINTSNEVIWQFSKTTGVSVFGKNFVAPPGSVPNYILYPSTYNAFEPGDVRQANWTQVVTIGSMPYYTVYKYKLGSASSGNEFDVVLRFAEQYLIRAEARAQQNTNISGAQADLDSIRLRAHLPVTAAGDKTSLLLAIEQERRVEFFGEWGHRWLDLKRTGRADAVIGVLKPTYKTTSQLYPIPEDQRKLNTNLTQNPGYQQ